MTTDEPKVRALIAEDSPTTRALLVELLTSDPSVELVGEARDGLEAVEMTARLRPAVITMDIRMPRMDGFEATRRIMAETPTPIVIVSAVSDSDQVDVSMSALRLGAVAVLRKPAGPGAPGHASDCADLVRTVKTMSRVKVVRHRLMPDDAQVAVTRPEPVEAGPYEVVALATSTGGPAALHHILSSLPARFPAPILVVQHIGEGFTHGLADWLGRASPLAVKVADDGDRLSPGSVYIAPDRHHLGVRADHRIALATTPPVGGFRPAATHLFRSVAELFGRASLNVILTGMGADGLEGLRVARERGGRIIAQDETSSVIFGMPGVVIAAGLADEVAPLDRVPTRLIELTTSAATLLGSEEPPRLTGRMGE